MPARRLLMRKIREILRLRHEQGLSHEAVAQACAVGVGTVNRYLRRAVRRGLGWPLPAELDDAALEARLFPRAAPAAGRARPDCAYIHRELKRDTIEYLAVLSGMEPFLLSRALFGFASHSKRTSPRISVMSFSEFPSCRALGDGAAFPISSELCGGTASCEAT